MGVEAVCHSITTITLKSNGLQQTIYHLPLSLWYTPDNRSLYTVRTILQAFIMGVEQNEISELHAPNGHGCSFGKDKHFLFDWYPHFFQIRPLPLQKKLTLQRVFEQREELNLGYQ